MKELFRQPFTANWIQALFPFMIELCGRSVIDQKQIEFTLLLIFDLCRFHFHQFPFIQIQPLYNQFVSLCFSKLTKECKKLTTVLLSYFEHLSVDLLRTLAQICRSDSDNAAFILRTISTNQTLDVAVFINFCLSIIF